MTHTPLSYRSNLAATRSQLLSETSLSEDELLRRESHELSERENEIASELDYIRWMMRHTRPIPLPRTSESSE